MLVGSRNERHFKLSEAGQSGFEGLEWTRLDFRGVVVEFGVVLLVDGVVVFPRLPANDFRGVLGLGCVGTGAWPGGVLGRIFRAGSVYELLSDTGRVRELGVDADGLLEKGKPIRLFAGC